MRPFARSRLAQDHCPKDQALTRWSKYVPRLVEAWIDSTARTARKSNLKKFAGHKEDPQAETNKGKGKP